jgi:hypothetical protein
VAGHRPAPFDIAPALTMLGRLVTSAISSRVPHGDKTLEGHMAKPDIYTRITEKIVADLQAGTRPWHKP